MGRPLITTRVTLLVRGGGAGSQHDISPSSYGVGGGGVQGLSITSLLGHTEWEEESGQNYKRYASHNVLKSLKGEQHHPLPPPARCDPSL